MRLTATPSHVLPHAMHRHLNLIVAGQQGCEQRRG